MTLEELKIEAEKYGYILTKKRKPLPKLLPCNCGRKRIDLWYQTPRGYVYKCPICGRKGIGGLTKQEARENWNKKVRSDEEE